MEPTLEKLDISDPASLDNWHERFDFFADTNSKITTSNRISWYVTLIGKEAYDLLKVLAFPDSITCKSVAELQKLLRDYLRPTHYEATKRARFHNLSRRSDETQRGFLLRIQRQAAKCNFGTDLQTQMRDRIVAGVNDSELQKRLLMIKKLTFDKAKEILETADAIRQDVDQSSATVLYNRPQAKSGKPSWQRGQGHQQATTSHQRSQSHQRYIPSAPAASLAPVNSTEPTEARAIPAAETTSVKLVDFAMPIATNARRLGTL